jgi:hyperosmotically inducible protein
VTRLARIGVMASLMLSGELVGERLADAGKSTTETESTTTATTKKKHKVRHPESNAAPAGEADNTGINKRDRKDSQPTADQQQNDKTDLTLTAEIRRSVVADKQLSTNAHNIKIIAQNGKVTLKGPVASAAEKRAVESKAAAIAGTSNVTSMIDVAK